YSVSFLQWQTIFHECLFILTQYSVLCTLYAVLRTEYRKLGHTSMSYFLIFRCRVGREIPSSSHTLPRLPWANLRALRICSFSTSSSNFIGEEAGSVPDFKMSPTDSAKLSSSKTSPWECTTARLKTFSSCRIFPGQSRLTSDCKARDWIRLILLLSSRFNLWMR